MISKKVHSSAYERVCGAESVISDR